MSTNKQTQYARNVIGELAHDQWAHWMKYLFSQGQFNPDGTWTMPAWAVDRWTRQMQTPYAELSESEQESDRKEADKFLEVVTLKSWPQSVLLD